MERAPGLRIETRRRRSSVTPFLLTLAVLGLVAGVLWWRMWPRTATTEPPPSAPDSLAALPPFEAYQQALALGERLHFVESLPYFRRALSDPPDAWQPYAAYGTALFQATHQVRSHRRFAQPVTRSSFERVNLVHEAGEALGRAERLAANPKDRAYVITLRMKHLMAWGLDWDAYSEFSRAEKLDPSLGPQGREIGGRLRNPTARER
jgi:hypothetical protein